MILRIENLLWDMLSAILWLPRKIAKTLGDKAASSPKKNIELISFFTHNAFLDGDTKLFLRGQFAWIFQFMLE